MSLADLRNHWLCRIHRPFPPSSGGSSNEAVIRNQGIVCERRFHHDLLIPGEQPLDTDDLGCKRRTMRVTCQSANDENFDLRTRQRSRPTAPRASSPISSRSVLVIAKCDASLVPGGAQACPCPQVGCTSRELGCIECRSRCPPRGLRHAVREVSYACRSGSCSRRQRWQIGSQRCRPWVWQTSQVDAPRRSVNDCAISWLPGAYTGTAARRESTPNR